MTVAHPEYVNQSQKFRATEAAQQYGVLPWRKDRYGRGQVLLISSRGRGRWIVPKGWPIEDTAPYMAAALEAFEEAGVIGEVSPKPLGNYHYTTEDEGGAQQPRRVTLFSFHVVGTLINWPERGERKRQWVSLSKAADMVDDPELAQIIGAINDAPETLMANGRRISRALSGPITAPPEAGDWSRPLLAHRPTA